MNVLKLSPEKVEEVINYKFTNWTTIEAGDLLKFEKTFPAFVPKIFLASKTCYSRSHGDVSECMSYLIKDECLQAIAILASFFERVGGVCDEDLIEHEIPNSDLITVYHAEDYDLSTVLESEYAKAKTVELHPHIVYHYNEHTPAYTHVYVVHSEGIISFDGFGENLNGCHVFDVLFKVMWIERLQKSLYPPSLERFYTFLEHYFFDITWSWPQNELSDTDKEIYCQIENL